jgi:iron complex outermembrane recepter protein
MPKKMALRTTLVALALSISISAHAVADSPKAIDVPAGDLSAALESLARQYGVDVIYPSEQLEGVRTHGVTGTLGVREAFTKLLEGTGLEIMSEAGGAILITLPRNPSAHPMPSTSTQMDESSDAHGKSLWEQLRPAQAPQGGDSSDAPGEKETDRETALRLPEVLIQGSKSLNMDIKRSRDDAQPYVVFEREAITRSGAANLEDFFKQRLTMNAQAGTNSQRTTFLGNMSEINLRGLGANQTLILVDGHRRASPMVGGGSPVQSDLNGIPLAAVERIEVLPSTASGIYGGSATGGVVNIVLRRDYVGSELKLTYDNTLDSDSSIRRLDFSAGFNLEDGRTNVLLAGYYSDSNVLTVQDRNFVQRGRERLLANNPSSLLGAADPPLGATTNIRSVNGSPLFGPGTPNLTSVPVGYAGGGGLTPLQVNAGQYNLGLSHSAQSAGPGGEHALLNSPTIGSLMMTVRRQFGSRVQAFLDMAGSNNSGYFETANFAGTFTIAADAPNNPFGQAIRVTVPTDAADSFNDVSSHDRNAVAGVTVRLGERWNAGLDYTWNRSRFSFRQPDFFHPSRGAPVSNGAIDVLRDTRLFPLDPAPFRPEWGGNVPLRSTLENATLRVAGPVGSLPGGAPTFSGLIEHREESFSGGEEMSPALGTFLHPSRSQSVDSAYLELKVPLVSPKNRIAGVHELELQLAGRWDEYTINGVTGTVGVGSDTPIVRATNKTTSTNPTVGMRYEPVQDLMLRASYGTGFLPPTVSQLASTTPGGGSFIPVADPLRDNVITQVFNQQIGGNPDLKPEDSDSWSFGMILSPRWAPGMRLSVDYTHIDKTDGITTLSAQQIVDNESVLPGRVVRAPAPPGEVGAITGLNRTAVNVATTEVEAYDFALDYELQMMRAGTFNFFAVGTRQTRFRTQLVPSAAVVENVGITSSFPLKLKVNAGLTWRHSEWTLGWIARYFDSYLVSTNATLMANQGQGGRVPSQTYHDAFVTWAAGSTRSSLLADTEVQLGLKNVFNTEPPFDASSGRLFSPYGDARMASYYLSLTKRL